ncbi:MAG TPA: UDP-N-acetylglucosamine acyltransferase [Polyangia bacterium]|nr:UDP-N-acetylglucosamine acyltransferase [Polyangia bacterium]
MATVHPSAILEGDVELADDVTVGPFCYLRGPLVVGPRTRIWPHVVIGTEGEHKTRTPAGVIRIGADTIVRELVVIQRGTGDRDTTIGDGCFVMDHCHIAHDVLVGDGVTMSPNVTLGGHTHVLRGATVGIGAMTHQFSTVGAYAMLGMGAVVTRDVPPFCLVAGNPARFARLNTHAFAAAGIGEADVRVEAGALVAADARVQALLDEFAAHSRRDRLAL